ncbi:nicotinate-nucleotide pyrophosphorylase [Acrasis kona]|uniref:Nicotinate-nucleotide pyrophosphorylase [carboxylating] n=1 Tax=Acrasis kona TaxID=1008807 RepID=A0AAW2Z8N2_9EUKA
MKDIRSLQLLLPPRPVLERKLLSFIEEDIPSFDIGAAVVGNQTASAALYFKSGNRSNKDSVILAGVPFFDILFNALGCEIQWSVEEGQDLMQIVNSDKKIKIASVTGPACKILQGERTCLNLLSRVSAVASWSAKLDCLKQKHNYKGEIAGTRKTTPGLRLFEKYALLLGGCSTHRYDLSQVVMLKDNHIDACNGSIEAAVTKAKEFGGFSTMIEVECRSLDDARRAASSGAHIVMLDNFNAEGAKSAAKTLHEEHPNVIVEVSGGLTFDTIADYFDDNVNVLSMGFLTEIGCYFAGGTVDFSLKIV